MRFGVVLASGLIALFHSAAEAAVISIDYGDITADTTEDFQTVPRGPKGTSESFTGFDLSGGNGIFVHRNIGGASAFCGDTTNGCAIDTRANPLTLDNFNTNTTEVGFQVRSTILNGINVTVNGHSGSEVFNFGPSRDFLIAFQDPTGISSILVSRAENNGNISIDNVITSAGDTLAPIPLPASFPLFLAALGAVALVKRKRT